MNKKTRRRIMALQATRVRGGINETTSRQRDGERTLGQVYARLFDDNGKIKSRAALRKARAGNEKSMG